MILLTNRNVLHLLTLYIYTYVCQARSLFDESSRINTANGLLWQPNEGTRSEWMACHGMPADVCERTESKKRELLKILAVKFGISYTEKDLYPDDGSVDQCILFTEEQLDVLIAEAKEEDNATSRYRVRRTLIDSKFYPSARWSMPIRYKFDGRHDYKQKAIIRRGFQHWADNTCIRFSELPMNSRFDSNHILITDGGKGRCSSFVGRTETPIPQQINLAPWCIETFGTVLHEIGHSLGLIHEQARTDGNNSIVILWGNIQMGSWPQYRPRRETDAFGLPYNYGSVMHYSSKGGNSLNGDDTMIALEPLYQMNMGQRSDLSFHDKKIINLAYCKEICKTPLKQPCQRGGYPHPNSCSTCICPDGFSGRYCDQIAPPKSANCGGIMNIQTGDRRVIKSPGYDNGGYSKQQECTWWIKAPHNYKVQLAFEGDFNIYCGSSACLDWVEIKYKNDLGLEGARFCCDHRPNVPVISESNEMMILFKSNYDFLPGITRERGFQAIVRPTLNGNGKSLFQCSFEKSSLRDNLCGMTQDKTDQFDWTVHKDRTPSFLYTGPNFAYDGDFYIYIEASKPRKPNDEARLFFPMLNFAGEVCVNFFYHMFGSDIETLKLVIITNFKSTVVWKRSGEVRNKWLQASVGVNLSISSQLQFIGVRGRGAYGDIGLDKISVESGPCAL